MLSAQIFRELPLEEQLAKTQTDYSNWEIWTEENLRTTNEDLSNKMKATKLKELQKLLKNYDFTYVWADDRNSRIRGEKQRDEILKLKNEIGEDGHKVWIKFLKDKGMMEGKDGVIMKIPYFEDKKTPRKNSYEKFFDAKLKSWKISSPDQLEGEAKKRFFDEVDKEWASKKETENDEVEVNESVQKSNSPRTLSEAVRQVTERSGFPEMDKVVRKGTLGYGDDRKVGQKSISAGSFCDAGNLYPEHLIPKWIPPSPQRKRGWQDK
jgi:hypothetical protein